MADTSEKTQRAADKRKRRAPAVSSGGRAPPRNLLASTRDELRAIQADLLELAQTRRALLAKDKRGTNSTIQLLPPKV